MKDNYQERLQRQLERIASALPGSAPAEISSFLHHFYAKVPAMELERLDAARAAAIAVSAHEFFAARPPGRPKIRIDAPAGESQGGHLSVELLNDDMPFLVDSLSAELTRQGFTIYETIHPIFRVRRDASGRLLEVVEKEASGTALESLIHFEISPLPEGQSADTLTQDLLEVLRQIRLAVEDWPRLVERAKRAREQLSALPGFDREEMQEVRDFLAWLTDRNFIFLGAAEYAFYDDKGKACLRAEPESLLGVLRGESVDLAPKGLEALPPESRHFLLVPHLIEITKSNRRSAVHRAVHMDYIGIKRFDTKGKVIGELRLLGLFTSLVYSQSIDQIPILRRKVARVLAQSGYAPASHDGKALKTILEFLPRDELFQMAEDELFDLGMGVLSLEARPGVRLFVRRDAFERFVSCLVFVPRERFSTQLRQQLQAILERSYAGAAGAFYTQLTDSPLARVHFIVRTTPGDIPPVDTAQVEAQMASVTYRWHDLLRAELLARHGERRGERLLRAYGAAFPDNYIGRYDVGSAVHDIGRMEEAQACGGLALELFRMKQEGDATVHLKIYNPAEEIALSDILPMLEHMGFRAIDEHPFLIAPQDGPPVWIRDFKLQLPPDDGLPLEQIKPLFEEALRRVWSAEVEDDRLGALVVRAGLGWREIVLLRAYVKYLKQIGFPYGQPAIEQALTAYPAIACELVALFHARFDPARHGAQEEGRIRARIEQLLAGVKSLADDRILRRIVELMQATLRSNYFQRGEAELPRAVLSLKFDSAKVPDLPKPCPYAEIFVYSPRVEGIHLRGGKVARGGLRWSDRREDFRTEVLGLMKAQTVKNAVIVPVGSKGGFVLKRPPVEGGREALQQEGVACYTLYLEGLLDLTDNIVENKIVPPQGVVRHDGDDPYLVVAADKGTATFSDIANGVSKSYGFWLGDAFASGGSAGYDHKKMGITARGGWISVARHFREMGMDIAAQDFTVAGIGDMSGDVFGNGMLLSERTLLIAAFNHQHIFLDPGPDPKKSFAERKRLFDLPRSTWKDYDVKRISKGGGLFERSAKTIALSPEARAVLAVEQETLPPDELVRAILSAPVDLLWNGGIGTYVKADDETHDQVGDRANNAVRVNGSQLRCKVAGEGGNLGFTQKGRIEYARGGGRINTDAIDNSAGVDCSDHEVNIKIALGPSIASGKLTPEARNALLSGMTEEVAALVLKDNTLQTQALTVAELQGVALLDSEHRLIRTLERDGLLDRNLEFLPSDKAIADLRASGKGLTRPEIAVLLAYSKLALYRDLLDSALPDLPYFRADLMRYFPKAMQEAFAAEIEAHRLRREIVATVMTNSLVNRAGPTFVFDLVEDTGLPAPAIASAYTVARDAFLLRGFWSDIEKAGDAVTAATQVELHAAVRRFLEGRTLWFLRHFPQPLDIEALIRKFKPGIAAYAAEMESMHSDATRKACGKQLAYWLERAVPDPLARSVSTLELLASACDALIVAEQTELPLGVAGKVYFALGARLRLGWLRLSASRVAAPTPWDRLALQTVMQELYDEQRRLTITLIETLCKDDSCSMSVEAWVEQHQEMVNRYDRFLGEVKAAGAPNLAMLLVALRQVKGLSTV